MLRAIRLHNFRSYVDTEKVALTKLNIFIGPNNAGKSAFLSGVELFLRSLRAFGPRPLPFEEISSFASFDSVLRRHWTPKDARPREFVLSYTWEPKKNWPMEIDFTCRGRATDNLSYVDEAVYKWPDGNSLTARMRDRSAPQPTYMIDSPDGEGIDSERVMFHGPFPLIFNSRITKDIPAGALDSFAQLEVVHPYRPVPRSYYVLDDPGLSAEDRLMLAFLIDTWRSRDKHSEGIKQRIIDNLTTLGLVTHIDVHQISKRLGPKVIEIKVAPTLKRQSVTIADVGFGLSQVLPLAACDARLTNGYLVAYQPEVHLHPFAQSRLADLFAKSIRRTNQIFVETHSPDLILRLQAQVAGGEVAPADVRVFCLSNERGTTKITPVDFDTKGSPKIPWPKGFLDTSLSLARTLAANRMEVK